ncbi:protein translocase subunit SecF [Candidatus Gottesmanbacteria bacterium]|nr:protein translocase subunit SecF [Candidatus Gottesmanbacteria bacterium]
MSEPNIIGKKKIFFLISGLVIIPGIVALVFWGLRPAIDFTGGTLLEFQISPQKTHSAESIRQVVEKESVEIASIQKSGENTYLLRLKPIDTIKNRELQNALKNGYGDITQLRYETVGPTIGSETTANAMKAVLIASVAIIIYIALAFRQVPKPYSSVKFGICAVAALIHDILVVVGIFSIFGHFFHVEIDTLFITALLTIMGFSVHDTIVVFDRIRENLQKMPSQSFEHIVNVSIIQTLARSLATSLTVIFTLFSLLLFGGESIRWFVVALLIGIVSGTYSSIFNAAPLLVFWEERKKR